jgi:hypothetical protein
MSSRSGPTMFPYWDDRGVPDLAQDRWELPAEFRAQIPPGYETLFLGTRSWCVFLTSELTLKILLYTTMRSSIIENIRSIWRGSSGAF